MERKMAVLILCFAMLISVTCFTFDALAAAGDISATGNLILPATTPTAGIIYSGAHRLIHTYGSGNFFAGESAGNLTMTGYNNTANGYGALYNNTNGNYNTASGYAALFFNTTGDNNTASGYGALYNNTTGDNNTANGYAALFFNTTGHDNTASGYQALSRNTTGDYNTASGYQALSRNTTGSNNTASGYQALYSNTTGFSNTASGVSALYSNTTGYFNTASGAWAGYTITTGDNNTFVGAFSDASANNLSNATAIGYEAIVNDSNMIRIGNAAVTVIQGQVDFSRVSDFRLKKDIEEIQQGLDFVKALRPVQYRLKSGNERIDFGFIAQEIEALLGTDYNVLGIGADADRALSLRYADFIAPMVKAIQEQQGEINELTARLARLEALLMNR
jgi:hypothetical protein